MTWLTLIALGVWLLVIQIRLARAEQSLRDLRHGGAPGREPAPVAAPAASTPRPNAASFPSPAPALQTNSVPPALASEAHAIARTRAVSPPPPPPQVNLVKWISENGLAWLGGGALALGGALLVAYAAQSGLFTPERRIGAAVTLGLLMIGAGEAIRRQRVAIPGGRHLLAAAAASGAGAATLYAAVWAAYGLYHFLPLTLAAGLLGACSLGLLGLALVHGEALAVVAILGAFAAPAICQPQNWIGVTLDGYLVVVAGAGLAACGRRGWWRAGILVLLGAAAWIWHRAGAGDTLGVAGLLTAIPALTLVLSPFPRPEGFRVSLPAVSLIGASAIWGLLSLADLQAQLVGVALCGAALAALTAAAVRQGQVAGASLLAPAVALGLIAIAHAGVTPAGLWPNAPTWFLVPIATLAASGLLLTLRVEAKSRVGVIGAAAAAAGLTFLRAPLAGAGGGPWLFLGSAAVFYAGATLIAGRSANVRHDLTLAAWFAAGSESLGLAIHSGVLPLAEPGDYAALGLALAVLARRLPWRGVVESAALAVLVSVLALLSVDVTGAALAGRLTEAQIGASGVAALVIQLLAWRALDGRDRPVTARETVSTAVILTGLITSFLILRRLALRDAAGQPGIDLFTEAALRSLLLLTAGLGLTVRGGPTPFARARGPAFLALGAAHGLMISGLFINPWWGWPTDWGGAPPLRVTGPPIVDEMTLAYLAPALLLAAGAWRLGRGQVWVARASAAASLMFGLLWAILETRRLYHHPMISDGPVGFAEAATYGLALLIVAWAPTAVVDRDFGGPFGRRTRAAASACRWLALAASAWLAIDGSNPWWGPIDIDFAMPTAYFTALAAAIGLTALLTRRDATGEPRLVGTAKVAVVLELFAGLTVAIRFGFHGLAVRTALAEAGVETWTYSAAWALFGLVVLAAGAQAGDRILRWLGLGVLLSATLKVFLFDMANLQGVIRAGSFLALGALLILGALAARRLDAGARKAAPPGPASGSGEIEPGR